MPIHYSIRPSETLFLQEGPPARYNGPVLKGIPVFHVREKFGSAVFQEIDTELVSFGRQQAHWKKAMLLQCSCEYKPGIHVRIALENHHHEFVKGMGKKELVTGQYYVMKGSVWKSRIFPRNAGRCDLLQMSWSIEFLKSILKNEHELLAELENMHPRLPEQFIGPARSMNPEMRAIINRLLNFDYSSGESESFLHQQMKHYLLILLEEIREFREIKKGVKERDWEKVCEIKENIDAGPYRQMTISAILSRTAITRHKISRLFPKLTGFSTDDYRRYIILREVARRIVNGDDPMKAYHSKAGYGHPSSLLKAFKKLFCCRLHELREDTWSEKEFTGNF